jgi:hypothetical protein
VAWGAGQSNTGQFPNFGQAMVPSGLRNVIAMAAGSEHSMALVAEPVLPTLRAQPQTSGELQTNGFRFLLSDDPDFAYIVEYSPNCADWFELGTNLITRLAGNEVEFVDTSATNVMQRFYRARRVP